MNVLLMRRAAVPLILLLSAPFVAQGESAKKSPSPKPAMARSMRPASADCELRTDMRKLWEDHVTWTRVYIISAVAGLPDTDAAAQRLLRNQVDIGDAIKPYYGEEAGNKLSGLLRDHIMIATEVIAAAKAMDNAKKEDATKRWFANGDDIASFLSAANPANWPGAEMRSMMRDHLSQTTAEVVARLQKDWPADVAAYDAVHDQAVKMADTLSSGISAQFPTRFSTAGTSMK
jgi:hypothetical protein